MRGAPGGGKSDLALRLIDGGARLVADDQTKLRRAGDQLHASAPAEIAGKIEVRGLGILSLPELAEARLRLVVDLVPAELVERLPELAEETLLGIGLPRVMLNPFEASAAAKLRFALAAAAGKIRLDRD